MRVQCKRWQINASCQATTPSHTSACHTCISCHLLTRTAMSCKMLHWLCTEYHQLRMQNLLAHAHGGLKSGPQSLLCTTVVQSQHFPRSWSLIHAHNACPPSPGLSAPSCTARRRRECSRCAPPFRDSGTRSPICTEMSVSESVSERVCVCELVSVGQRKHSPPSHSRPVSLKSACLIDFSPAFA